MTVSSVVKLFFAYCRGETSVTLSLSAVYICMQIFTGFLYNSMYCVLSLVHDEIKHTRQTVLSIITVSKKKVTSVLQKQQRFSRTIFSTSLISIRSGFLQYTMNIWLFQIKILLQYIQSLTVYNGYQIYCYYTLNFSLSGFKLWKLLVLSYSNIVSKFKNNQTIC